jgi:hypothetical protein
MVLWSGRTALAFIRTGLHGDSTACWSLMMGSAARRGPNRLFVFHRACILSVQPFYSRLLEPCPQRT